MLESSISITSASAVNKPITTTESLGRDIDHFTTLDETMTVTTKELVENNILVVIVDSKLNTVLSATALAMVLVVAVVVFVLVVVQICAHKRKAMVSKSAQIELIKN